MSQRADLRRYRNNLQNEQEGAALYRVMAQAENQPELAELYSRLAKVEEAHADFWQRRIEHAGGARQRPRLRWRVRLLIWAAKRFGARLILPTVASSEALNRHIYDQQPETDHTDLPAQERSHARLLSQLASHASGGWDGARYARLEGRHGAGGGNTLRAMVLGANDGLVSTFCLIMGVAGASTSPSALLTAALAGTLAGACSMAMGEWISVQSSRELMEQQIAAEAEELVNAPHEEKEELALIYQAKGFSAEEADTIASRVMQDSHSSLDTLVREELGINPDDLGGSAWAAAASSFAVFLLGALIPALPVFLVAPQHIVSASMIAASSGLFLLGALITVFTGRHPLLSGLRQLLIGLVAAGVTFGIGRLFGVMTGA